MPNPNNVKLSSTIDYFEPSMIMPLSTQNHWMKRAKQVSPPRQVKIQEKLHGFSFNQRLKSLTPSKWENRKNHNELKPIVQLVPFKQSPKYTEWQTNQLNQQDGNRQSQFKDVEAIDVSNIPIVETEIIQGFTANDKVQHIFNKKIDKLNQVMLDNIDKTSKKFRQNIDVLKFQQQLQGKKKKELRLLGRSDFFTIKEEFTKAQRREQRKLRREQMNNHAIVELNQQNGEILPEIQELSYSKLQDQQERLAVFKQKLREQRMNHSQILGPIITSNYLDIQSPITQATSGNPSIQDLSFLQIKPIHYKNKLSFASELKNQIFKTLTMKESANSDQNNQNSGNQIKIIIPKKIYNESQMSHINIQQDFEQQQSKSYIAQLEQDYENKMNQIVAQSMPLPMFEEEINEDDLYKEHDKDQEQENIMIDIINGTFKEELDKYFVEQEDKPFLSKRLKVFKKQFTTEQAKYEHMDLLANSNKPKFREAFKDDPRFKFLEICKKEKITPISILHQLNSSRMVLRDVKLNLGLCKALAHTINDVDGYKLKYIYLENNGLDDEWFPSFLHQLRARNELISMIFVDNELGENTINMILDIAEELSYLKFNQLKFARCRLKVPITEFLNQLESRIPVRKLSLVSMDLGDTNALQLMSYLKSNPNLIDLDISWNKISPVMMIKLLELLRKINQVQCLNLSWNSLSIENQKLMNHTLNSYIKNSSNLIHLDLSNTNLKDQFLLQVVSNVSKSMTFMSLHLSGNELGDQLKLKIRKILKSQEYYQNNSINEQIHHNIPQDKSEVIIDAFNQKSLREDQFAKKQNLSFQSDLTEKYVIWRIIGQHELNKELKNKDWQYDSQWYECHHCWVCDQWRYFVTCSLESEFIEEYKENTQTNKIFNQLVDRLSQEDIFDLEVDNYYVIGTFTQWKFVKMQKLVHLMQRIDPGGINYKEQKRSDKELWKYYSQVWMFKFQKYLHYKPFYDRLIRKPLSDTDVLWIFCDIVPPGKHNYFIVSKDEKDVLKKFYYSTVVKIRNEDVKRNVLQKRKQEKLQRVFSKNNSLFKDWVEPTQTGYQKIIENLQDQWKITRLIKEEDDLKACNEILLKNIELLLNVNKTIVANSNYPSITLNDFTNFGNNTNLFDNRFGLSTFDRLFIATNASGGNTNESVSQELRRFEFFEVLIRISGAKFRDTAVCQNFSQSLQMLISEHIQPYYENLCLEHQRYRQNVIWTLGVNDMLNVNISSLKKLYTQLQNRTNERIITLKIAIDFLMKDFNLLDREVTYCYCMSKMTIINDLDKQNYLKLNFVEFLDFICRICDIAIANDIPLHKKLKPFLLKIFLTFGQKFTDFNEEMLEDAQKENENESDYDQY